MADNLTLESVGTPGEDIATDDIGGVHYQIAKLAFGALDSATLAASGAGAVTAGVQRITLASDDPAVTALQILDDWDESDRAAVNLIAAQAGITGGAGAVAANTPRVTLASDDPAVVSLAILDDWDESDRAKVNPIVGQAGIAAGAGAVAATVPRVTLASDDPAVALLGTIDADTGAIKTAVELIDNAISGSEMQVDVVAALPAGTNAIGKLAANTGVDIGDVDVTSIVPGTAATNLGKAEDAAHGSGDTGVMALAVRNDVLAALGGTDGDYVPLQTSALGALFVTLAPETSGGLSIYYDDDLDETAIAVKASAGQIYAIHAFNSTAAPLFLQLFNVAQGSVTVGTTTPTMQYIIPGNADSDGSGFVLEVPHGIAFGTAITVACTTNNGGNGAPGANACVIDILYK